MGLFDSGGFLDTYVNPINVLNPFSGNNPLTGKKGLGWYGNDANLNSLMRDPGQAPKLPQYRKLRNADGSAYKDPTAVQAQGGPSVNAALAGTPQAAQTYQAAGPASAQAALLSDPRFGQLDQSGIDANADLALGTGRTAWGGLQQSRNDLATAGMRQDTEQQAASGISSALDQVGMNGGYTGGTAERAALSGQMNRLSGLQNVGADHARRSLDIDIADQGRRDAALSQLPGMQMAAGQFDMQNAGIQNQADATNTNTLNAFSQFNAGRQDANNQFNAGVQNQGAQFNASRLDANDVFNATAQNNASQFNAGQQQANNQYNANATNAMSQFNSGQAMSEAQRGSAFDAANYGSQAGIYGGINQANGTIAAAAAGKKSGTSFLCTELRNRDMMTARESKIMVDFMIRSLPKRADFFAWYFANAPKLIALMNSRREDDWSVIKQGSVTNVIDLIEQGKDVEAQNVYILVIEMLNRQHGNPMGPMAASIRKPGLAKSLLALPVVFSMKSTWKWIGEFANAKYQRQVRKMWRTA